jgi:hypothetical protein
MDPFSVENMVVPLKRSGEFLTVFLSQKGRGVVRPHSGTKTEHLLTVHSRTFLIEIRENVR